MAQFVKLAGSGLTALRTIDERLVSYIDYTFSIYLVSFLLIFTYQKAKQLHFCKEDNITHWNQKRGYTFKIIRYHEISKNI